MDRIENWNNIYNDVWNFISENHRAPSRHHIEEHRLLNWLKFNRKKLNLGLLDDERRDKMQKLQSFLHSFHRINQYM